MTPEECLSAAGCVMETATLKRLSICPCGYGAMNDDIPLGKAYQVNWTI